MVRRFLKILLYFFSFIILFIVAAWFLLQNQGVQYYITTKIAGYLSEKLNTRVEVGGVNIEFIKSIVLEDVYIEGQDKDTLVFISGVDAELEDFDIGNQKIWLSKINLDELYGNIKADTSGKMNFQFILDAFKSEEPPDTTTKGWEIDCHNFMLENSRFAFKRNGVTPTDSVLNFSDLYLTELNASIENLSKATDSITLQLTNMSFRDKSGFHLKTFTAGIIHDTSKTNLLNCDVLTDSTFLSFDKLNLKYNNYDDFKDFFNLVKLEIAIDSSLINTCDLATIVPFFAGFDKKIYLKGKIKGQLSDLRCKNIEFSFGKYTTFNGNINIEGLPDVSQLFLIADINKLTTHINDIEEIKLPPFKENRKIQIPENFQNAGNITYQGNFTGFLNDFVTYGEFETGLGSLFTDLSVKDDSVKKVISFGGKVRAGNLNLGKISGNPEMLGTTSLSLKINGKTTYANKISAKLEGVINNIEVNKYSYNNLKVNGELVDKKFDGAILSDDPNAKLEFLGRVDFTEKIPEFDFTADVRNLNFYKLNFYKDDSLTKASFLLSANFTGNNIDNMLGNIQFYNLKASNSRGTAKINEFSLLIDQADSVRNITLKSDLLDFEASGKYQFSSIAQSISNIAAKYVPSFIRSSIKADDTQNSENIFAFSLDIKKGFGPFSELFLPQLKIAPNTHLKGNFDSESKNLDYKLTSDSLIYDTYKLYDAQVTTRTKKDLISIYVEASKISASGIGFHNFMLNTEVYSDSIEFNTHWLNDDTLRYSGDINATAHFISKEGQQKPEIVLNFRQSNFVIAENMWNISENIVTIDTSDISIDNLTISNQKQNLTFYGKISHLPQDTLFMDFKDVNLTNVNTFTGKNGTKISGILNGKASVSDVYNKFTFGSGLKVDSLVINKEQFGNFFINSNWDNSSKKIHLLAYTKRGNIRTFSVLGDYMPSTNQMDFVLSLDKLRLNIFDPFVKGILTDLRGIASGDIHITGKPADPELDGSLTLQKSAFTVDFLQTRYNFSNTIHISKNAFECKDVTIFDMNGNSAVTTGKITHTKFSDLKFDINVNANKFCFLNTTQKDNDLYYGTAYASGVIDVKGDPDNILIDIVAKTEKNTKFYIPLSSGSEVAESNFVRFINSNTDQKKEEDYKVNLSGIQLNFDLEATPESEIQIIFDSKVGDVIKAKGAGNLNMEINTLGQFSMYGEYVIEEGDYLFTLQNVINKKFDIEKGSSIKWNGSPYEAYMDINAIYKLKAPLFDLVLDTSDVYKKRTPVECNLRMSDYLSAPVIKFDVNVPNADDKVKSQLNNLSEEEMNKEILSLLVLSRFYTPDNLRGSAGTDTKASGVVSANSGELLSNQLSHWLSQISNDFDIGVNYRPGDEISSDELEVALSTQIFNDRVSINGNVGVGGHQTTQSGIVGDFNVDVKVNKSGKLRVKGFTKSNDNTVYESASTQGIGMFYKEEFNTMGDLYRKYFVRKKTLKLKNAQ